MVVAAVVTTVVTNYHGVTTPPARLALTLMPSILSAVLAIFSFFFLNRKPGKNTLLFQT